MPHYIVPDHTTLYYTISQHIHSTPLYHIGIWWPISYDAISITTLYHTIQYAMSDSILYYHIQQHAITFQFFIYHYFDIF